MLALLIWAQSDIALQKKLNFLQQKMYINCTLQSRISCILPEICSIMQCFLQISLGAKVQEILLLLLCTQNLNKYVRYMHHACITALQFQCRLIAMPHSAAVISCATHHPCQDPCCNTARKCPQTTELMSQCLLSELQLLSQHKTVIHTQLEVADISQLVAAWYYIWCAPIQLVIFLYLTNFIVFVSS